jgi:hypothetical protein
MIRKKPAPHLMRGGYRFSEKIMLNQKPSARIAHFAVSGARMKVATASISVLSSGRSDWL